MSPLFVNSHPIPHPYSKSAINSFGYFPQLPHSNQSPFPSCPTPPPMLLSNKIPPSTQEPSQILKKLFNFIKFSSIYNHMHCHNNVSSQYSFTPFINFLVKFHLNYVECHWKSHSLNIYQSASLVLITAASACLTLK